MTVFRDIANIAYLLGVFLWEIYGDIVLIVRGFHLDSVKVYRILPSQRSAKQTAMVQTV